MTSVSIQPKKSGFSSTVQTVKSAKPKTTPYIAPRRIYRRAVVNTPPSKECFAEIRALRSEFDYLFSGFTADKEIVSRRRANCKLAERRRQEEARIKRSHQFREIGTSSFAAACVAGPHNEAPVVRLVEDKPKPKKIPLGRSACVWTRREARQDYSESYRTIQSTRQEFRKLAEAMAKRHPRVTTAWRFERVEVPLARSYFRKNLRAKEVEEFPFDIEECQNEYPRVSTSGWIKPTCCIKVGSVGASYVHPGKSQKVRSVIREQETDRTGLEYPVEFYSTRNSRRSSLIRALERTVLGRALMLGFLRVLVARNKVDISSLDSLVSSLKGVITPQMDPQGVVSQVSTTETKKSNVVIDSLQPVDRGVPHSFIDGFKEFSISRENQTFSTLSDRWIRLGGFTWSTGQAFDSEVYYCMLPHWALLNNKDSPNVQLFLLHRWFRGAMRIRLVLNSNKFQIGQLIAGWHYGVPSKEGRLHHNVSSYLQRNHCRLNAGSSNDAELVVPYHYMDSMMSLSNDAKLGQLSVRVLNPLVVTTGVAPSCSVSVFVSFEDTEFFGLISRSLQASIQMDIQSVTSLLNAGSNLISTFRGDPNRDLPPIPLQPMCLVPQAMPSMAYMDGVGSPVNVLRADSRGQTPHCDVVDEMNPYALMRGWGFIQSISWSVTQAEGVQLYSVPVVPLCSMDEYRSLYVSGDYGSGYCLPPLAFISSFFGLFRGSLEFKFQAVCSAFHTGRVMVGCIPFYTSRSASLEILKYSPYKLYDLADSTEFIFETPWHWKNSFARVRSSAAPDDIPSRLFVLVVNPLIAIDSVSPSIYLNVFLRAGRNYEVALPRAPILDPVLKEPLVPPVNSYLVAFNPENYWYTTWERNLVVSGGFALTIYFQNITDGWVGYQNALLGKVYELQTKTTAGRPFRCQYYTRDGQLMEIKYGVYDPALSTTSAHGLVLFNQDGKDEAFIAARLFSKARNEADQKVARKGASWWYQDGPWSQYKDSSGEWKTCDDSNDPPLWLMLPDKVDDDFVYLPSGRNLRSGDVRPQMDDRAEVVVTSLDQPSPSTGAGLKVFGESTPDLKSLCRRFNHLCSIFAVTSVLKHPRDAPYSARIRVSPFRILDPTSSASYDNRYRHGIITSIGSMYRLWRGGLRYRFVVVGAPPEGTIVYVQHRFDIIMTGDQIVESGPSSVKTRDDMMNTQYATFSQALSVNASFTIEVPYYNEHEALSTFPGEKGLLGDLGSLFIWVHAREKTTVHLEVFYSFADDTRFSVFQGVPICKDINDIVPEPQMDTQPQGIFDSVKQTFSAPAQVAADVRVVKEEAVTVASDIKKVTNRLGQLTSSLHDFVGKGKETFKAKLSSCGKASPETKAKLAFGAMSYFKDELFGIVTHLIYMFLNPSKTTIAWALVNLYHHLFGFSLDGITVVASFVELCFHKAKRAFETNLSKHPQGKTVEPQDDSNPAASYASLIFMAISSFCKLTVTPPTSLKNVVDDFNYLGFASRGALNVGRFIESNLVLIKKIYRCFLSVFGSQSTNFNFIMGINDDRIKEWMVESSLVTSPQYESLINERSEWTQKVFELAVVGRSMEMTLVRDKATPPRLLTLCRDLNSALRKVERNLVDSKVYSGVRYEPFCVWISGSAGTGKTRFAQRLAKEFAKRAGYTGHQSYHVITPGQKYMDVLKDQPSIMIDDFCTMSPSADPESYAQFLVMKSSALWNPPYSQAEEKRKLINFQNLIVTSNRNYVANMPGINEPDAFNRRRDVLLNFHFRANSTTADNLKQKFSTSELAQGSHLLVKVPSSILVPSQENISIPITVRDSGADYIQDVLDFVMEKHDAYHRSQVEVFATASKRLLDDLDNVASSSDKYEDHLKSYVEALQKHQTGSSECVSAVFEKWMSKTMESSTYNPKLVPQGEEGGNPFGECWPEEHKSAFLFTDVKNANSGLLTPLDREALGQPRLDATVVCNHISFDPIYPIYDQMEGLYYSARLSHFRNDHSYSAMHSVCLVKDADGKVSESDSCSFRTKAGRERFYRSVVGVDLSVTIMKQPVEEIEILLSGYHPDIINYYKELKSEKPNQILAKKIADNNRCQIEQLFNTQSSQTECIADIALPKRTRWQAISQGLWSLLLELFSFLWKVIKSCLVFVTVFFVIFFSLGLAERLTNATGIIPEQTPIEPNLHPSGDFKTVRQAKTVKSRSLQLIENQGGVVSSDSEIVDLCELRRNNAGLINKIVKNSFFLVGKSFVGDGKYLVFKARCLGLYNHKFLVLKHYIEHFKANNVTEVVVVYHKGEGAISYPFSQFSFNWTEEGYGVGELPPSAPRQFSNITKFMPSEKFDGNYPSDCFILEIFTSDVREHSLRARKINYPVIVPSTSSSTTWTITQGFEYAWGGKGRCGSLLIAPSMACPLIGVHTAGLDDKIGYAELLLKETFISEVDNVIEYVNPQMASSPSVYGLEGDYDEIGCLDSDMAVSSGNETRIIPSEISGVFPIKSGPAPLKGSDPRLDFHDDIFKIGVSKRCKPLLEFPVSFVQDAYMDMVRKLRLVALPQRTTCGPLNVTLSIEGCSVEGYDPIEMNTSEGYPWVNMRPKTCTDKSWMFDISQYSNGRLKIDGVIPDLKRVLDFKLDCRKRGVVPASYFTACLKDARLPLSKISIPGKTRLFEISPVDLTIVQRQYYLDFLVGYRKARLSAEHTIGINPDGPEWTQLANQLQNFSSFILTADFSGYGPSLSHTIAFRVFDIMSAWYEKYEDLPEEIKFDNFMVRECLKHEVIKGLHVAKNLVFRPTSGIPSGNCSTVEINSLANSLYWRVIYLCLSRKHAPHYGDLYWFSKFVLLFHNGDDVIASISPTIIEWFNNETIIEEFGKFGLKMTDALKEGVVRKFCSLEEATYLKRGFLVHPVRKGQWLAPLEEASITETANWVWKSVDHRSASLVNSEMACRLAYTRGPEFYLATCNKIQERWASLDVPFNFPSWESLDSHVWEGTEGPRYSF